jgi:hypothetical protein
MQEVNRGAVATALLLPDNVHIFVVEEEEEDSDILKHVTGICDDKTIKRVLAKGIPQNLPRDIPSTPVYEDLELHTKAREVCNRFMAPVPVAVSAAVVAAPAPAAPESEPLYKQPGTRDEFFKWVQWLQTPDVINKLF